MLDVETLEDLAIFLLCGEWGWSIQICDRNLSECYMYAILFMLPFMYIFEKKKHKISDIRMTKYEMVTSDNVLIWKSGGLLLKDKMSFVVFAINI